MMLNDWRCDELLDLVPLSGRRRTRQLRQFTARAETSNNWSITPVYAAGRSFADYGGGVCRCAIAH